MGARLPRRRAAEIEYLRAVLHAHHLAQRPAGPVRVEVTEPMSRCLSRRRGTLTCSVCGAAF